MSRDGGLLAAATHLASPLPELRWENAHSIVESQIKADGLHVWPFNPSFPVEVRSFVFEENHNVRLTRHDYFEIVYVLEGEALYQVQNCDLAVKAGDVIVLNGALYHRLKTILRGPLKFVVLYFLPDVLRAGGPSGEPAQYLAPFLMQGPNFPHVISGATGLPQKVLELILRMRSELPSTTDRGRLIARTCLEMILILLINHYKEDLSMFKVCEYRQRALERMRPLFDFLETHYSESIALSRATSIVGMSKPHFMRSFKKVTGQPFDAYLNHFRIAKAQALLSMTDKSIAKVSQEVGFCDQSYFGLVFRRLVQVTPREYRKRFTLG